MVIHTIVTSLKFIDSYTFMSSKLSELINNLFEIYSYECRGCKERKKVKSVCDFTELKNNKLHYKWKKRKNRLSTPISGLIKKFPNTYRFCNNDINTSATEVFSAVFPQDSGTFAPWAPIP